MRGRGLEGLFALERGAVLMDVRTTGLLLGNTSGTRWTRGAWSTGLPRPRAVGTSRRTDYAARSALPV